jgi:hypothetical protein
MKSIIILLLVFGGCASTSLIQYRKQLQKEMVMIEVFKEWEKKEFPKAEPACMAFYLSGKSQLTSIIKDQAELIGHILHLGSNKQH